MKPTVCLLLFALSAPVALTAPPESAKCTRVHPGISFPRERLLDPEDLAASAALPDDEGFLLLYEYGWSDPTPGRNLRLALASGTGSLEIGPPTRIHGPNEPLEIFSRDFNADGVPDAVVQRVGTYTSFFLEFLPGRSDGTFGEPVRWSPSFAASTLPPIAGDFDGDGIDELAFHFAEQASFYLLEVIDGSWSWSITSGIGGDGKLVPGVDWDEDGIDDLVLARSAPGYAWFLVALGSSTTPFAVREEYVLEEGADEFGSFNGRLLASRKIPGTIATPPRLINLRALERGESGLRESWRYEGQEGDQDARWPTDIDGDGLQDLQIYDRNGQDVHWGSASGAPSSPTRYERYDFFIYALDLDADGLNESITSSWTVVRQRVAREFLANDLVVTQIYRGTLDEPYASLEVGDLNEDGLDDLVTQTFYADTFHAALSRGDGTFELLPFDMDPREFSDPYLLDIDLDGHLDMIPGGGDLSVAWGRGDGTFDFEHLEERPRYSWRVPIEIDGRPGVDLISGVTDYSTHPRTYRLRTLVFDTASQTWSPTGYTAECTWLAHCPYSAAPVDLDGDGLDDILDTSYDGTSVSIHWWQGLGEAGFADPEILVDGLDRGYWSKRLDVADLDRDGTMDILYQAGVNYRDPPGLNTTLRGLGDNRFEIIWQGERMSLDWHDWEIEERLFDVDGDGRLDLVAGHYHPFYAPRYYMEIRRGDGLGGFLPPQSSHWRAPTGEMGVFRHEGTRDMVELQTGTWWWGTMEIELLPSNGYVLPEDNAAPVSELRLVAAGVDTWRPAYLPLDECDSTPQRLGALIEFPELGPGSLLSYEVAETREILTFDAPDGSRRGVLLRGPSRAEMVALFNELRAQGGVPAAYMQPLELRISESAPPLPGGPLPNAALIQRVVIEEGRVVVVEAFGPGADIIFAMSASDRSGKIGITRARVSEHLPAPR